MCLQGFTARGVQANLPDECIIFPPGKRDNLGWIELKAGTALRPAQVANHRALRSLGDSVYVVTCLSEYQSAMADFLGTFRPAFAFLADVTPWTPPPLSTLPAPRKPRSASKAWLAACAASKRLRSASPPPPEHSNDERSSSSCDEDDESWLPAYARIQPIQTFPSAMHANILPEVVVDRPLVAPSPMGVVYTFRPPPETVYRYRTPRVDLTDEPVVSAPAMVSAPAVFINLTEEEAVVSVAPVPSAPVPSAPVLSAPMPSAPVLSARSARCAVASALPCGRVAGVGDWSEEGGMSEALADVRAEALEAIGHMNEKRSGLAQKHRDWQLSQLERRINEGPRGVGRLVSRTLDFS